MIKQYMKQWENRLRDPQKPGRVLKLICLVMALVILVPNSRLLGIGKFGDPDYNPGKVERPKRPIEADGGGDEKVEVDESKPAELQEIQPILPLKEGKLADRPVLDGDTLITSSDTHELFFNEETMALKVRDKKDQYTWSSAMPEENIKNLSYVWQAFTTAPIVIDYMDPTRASTVNRDFPELDSYEVLDDGVRLVLHFPTAKMLITADFLLDESRLTVDIKDENFVYEDGEDRKFDISQLYVLPFWGAVDADETEGYIFIPDGSGALMRFGGERPYRTAYKERVYGKDHGMHRDGMTLTRLPQVENMMIHVPVYGISHGHKQHATLMVIERGAEYADIFASPAGVRVNTFWTTSIFNYIESFTQPTGRAGKGFPHIYRDPNPVDPRVTLHLLRDNDADYVGMARTYRNELIRQGELRSVEDENPDLRPFPLLITAFMSELERGLIGTRTVTMTSFQNILDWQPELSELADGGLILSLIGAQRGGASGHGLGNDDIARAVGGESGFRELRERADEDDFRLLIHSDLATGYDPQLNRGEMIYNVDRSIAFKPTQNPIYEFLYFLNSAGLEERVNRLIHSDRFDERVGVEAGSIGYYLLSDHKDGIKVDRGTMMARVRENMEALGDAHATFIESPHRYLWSVTDHFYNVPTQHTQFVFENDAVPFLQIVLSGQKQMFAPYLNFGEQGRQTLLKAIDYMLFPSFLLTQEPPAKLMNSNTQNIYFSEYAALKDDIVRSYEYIRQFLDPVRGQAITDREVLAEDVSLVTYSNGIRILINYSEQPFDFEGRTVGAEDAALLDEGVS